MPRKRSKNDFLPSRVYWYHGAFRYKVSKEEYPLFKTHWVNLGKTPVEMWRNYYEKIQKRYYPEQKTMKDILTRFVDERAPRKYTPKSLENCRLAIPLLIETFGHAIPEEIKSNDIYAYLDERAKHSEAQANKEVGYLSQAFKAGIRWGWCEFNPAAQIERFPEKADDEKIELKEFVKATRLDPYMGACMKLAFRTSLRLSNMLSIQVDHLTKEGILVHITKTDEWAIIQWTPHLKRIMKILLDYRATRPRLSPTVICNRSGRPFTSDGFQTKWIAYRGKLLEANLIAKRFKWKTIRSLAGDVARKRHNIYFAQQLLGHHSPKTTQKHYLRWPKEIIPL